MYLPMNMEQSVPKRRHINSRRRVITQKKAYNLQNTAKAWNQDYNLHSQSYLWAHNSFSGLDFLIYCFFYFSIINEFEKKIVES